MGSTTVRDDDGVNRYPLRLFLFESLFAPTQANATFPDEPRCNPSKAKNLRYSGENHIDPPQTIINGEHNNNNTKSA